MLIRLDNPRLVINAQEFPDHVILMILRLGEASGDVVGSYVDTGGSNQRVQRNITPSRSLSVFEDMEVREFVLPFWELHDGLGRRAATGGFHFTATSAFRAQGGVYGTRIIEFTMIFPVIGGGIIRINIGGQEWDLANPTFNPNAQIPEINRNYGAGAGNEYESGPPGINNQRVPDDVLLNAYRRTHNGYANRGRAEEIERRRRERLANFDLQEAPQEAPPPDPVEQRRQSRLEQARAAEASQNFILEPSGKPGGVNLVVAPSKPTKAPPKTRFERNDD